MGKTSFLEYWEITVKLSLGKLKLDDGWQTILERGKKVNRILDLPVYQKHCEPHVHLPWHHKDPFDRFLICQALSENLIILTKKATIRKYKVKTAW